MAEANRLAAALMLLVASCERVMIECAEDPALADLFMATGQLRDRGSAIIHEISPARPTRYDRPAGPPGL